MSATSSSVFLNKTTFFTEIYERMDSNDAQRQSSVLLFCVSFIIALLTLVGSIYLLLSLLRIRTKSSLSLIVAALSIDDLISVVPVSVFMFMQWRENHQTNTLCTSSALLFLFQGLSSNLKAGLIASYTFYVTKFFGAFQAARRPLRILWSVIAIWITSLTVSILPLCGWGSFTRKSWGCFPDTLSSYVLLIFVLYAFSFCLVLIFSVPLSYRLLCSDEQQKAFDPSYCEMTGVPTSDGVTPISNVSIFSREDSTEKSFRKEKEIFSLEPGLLKSNIENHTRPGTDASRLQRNDHIMTKSPVFFAQKRFALILCMARIILWMPMMIQLLVGHVIHFSSPSFETLSFVLTLLSAAVTPVFVLSERWIHLPCGCFINCKRTAYTMSPDSARVKKRGFQFNLSFQQGHGIYKITEPNNFRAEKCPPYFNLTNHNSEKQKSHQIEACRLSRQGSLEFRTTALKDSSLQTDFQKSLTVEAKPESVRERAGGSHSFHFSMTGSSVQEENSLEDSPVFEGPDRRLSHEECRKLELTDWEWCRSKSERTPRQRSTGGLAIPLCAFQGTVSLHAPTGKTLSLSTYEVSSDGQKITPTAKKIEVYRSKSVGHEPNIDETPNGAMDTNVKIHLEVLEICDNEEAMDTVSIVSNISQSSAHARSPSLRYSRRENRFVSCDLGETASYSLFIPTNNPDSDINISIPDTVEAHRQNSKKQHRDKSGYQEEIQLLNEAYRKQEEDSNKCRQEVI
ncbi:probable G-protein coupled receptor 149 [Erpetoichthys calabaricus]|uniref:probable G-protein coupled receptor 149 n=1 Tax=Erpetoichthys calabaricus TaxID=27687 RepID=UPI0010A017AA|nr:probable G-protein coupled receptor 149 [Erpetoichthys calabaricus]